MAETIEHRKARLSHVITTLETLVDDNDGYISGHAIGLLNESLVEVNAELQLLQEHDYA